jgi:hypothetical protein
VVLGFGLCRPLRVIVAGLRMLAVLPGPASLDLKLQRQAEKRTNDNDGGRERLRCRGWGLQRPYG